MNRIALSIAMLALCGACSDGGDPGRSPVPGQIPGVTGIRYLASGDNEGFLRADGARAFSFPADHGPHPGFRTEWWYLTGNLETGTGRHFGFELTFFRVALSPRAIPRASSWASENVWMGHFALTDTEGGRFLAAEKLERGALGLAGAETSPLRIWIDDWRVEEGRPGTLSVEASEGAAKIALELQGLDRIVLQGEDGLDPKGPEAGNASYYYSAPRLEARGSVTTVGGEVAGVSGSAWLDREWSTSALSDGMAGWDWFGLQLDDGRDLMFYRLRRTDGRTSPSSGGTITDASGDTRRLTADDVDLSILETWRSPDSGVVYPVAWRMQIPAQDLDLRITPYLPQQELNVSVRYWEGAVAVSRMGQTDSLLGRGYLELAGY